MTPMLENIFAKYPRLLNLHGKVPDEVIECELKIKAELFEQYSPLAASHIPTTTLNTIFGSKMESGAVTLKNFLGQWGNISVEEVAKIALIVKWLKPKVIFEFGTFNGMTTLQMAINSPKSCKIITLDIDPESVDAKTLEVGEIDAYLAKKTGVFSIDIGQYFKNTRYESKIKQRLGDSSTIDLSGFFNKADIVFVDAGHTYKYVKCDSENAFQIVKKNGVIIWHDYMQVLHPDVMKALCEYASKGKKIYHLKNTNLAIHYKS